MTMRKILGALTGIATLIGVSSVASAAPDLKPGLWEMTVTSNIPGMPMAPPPFTQRKCLDDKDVIPKSEQPDQTCQDIQHSVKGNTVNWSIRCEQNGTTTVGNGTLTYAGESYSGSMQLEMQGGEMGAMTMSQRLQGRRIGDCPR